MTVTTTKGWAEHASCRGLDAEIFMATRGDLLKIREAKKAMEKAAKDLDFMQAAKLRDDIKRLQGQLT